MTSKLNSCNSKLLGANVLRQKSVQTKATNYFLM